MMFKSSEDLHIYELSSTQCLQWTFQRYLSTDENECEAHISQRQPGMGLECFEHSLCHATTTTTRYVDVE